MERVEMGSDYDHLFISSDGGRLRQGGGRLCSIQRHAATLALLTMVQMEQLIKVRTSRKTTTLHLAQEN